MTTTEVSIKISTRVGTEMSTIAHTLTVEVVITDAHTIPVKVHHTTLSDEQVRVMAGLLFVERYLKHNSFKNFNDYLDCELNGTVMTECNSSYSWDGDVISCSECYEGVVNSWSYQVSSEDGYLILHCAKNSDRQEITVSFKDGLLHSIGDEPAVKLDTVGVKQSCWKARIWFHHSKCYRNSHPHLPSEILYDQYAHHNIEGHIHRHIGEGPASYAMSEGRLKDSEYAVDGVWQDHMDSCEDVERVKVKLKVKLRIQVRVKVKDAAAKVKEATVT